MNFLTDSIRPIYFKYLTAAFGSALISSIYGVVDAAMVGQYQGPAGTAALAVVAPVWNIIYAWACSPASAAACCSAPLALPLGELSPKVTERGLQAFLNGDINLCAHAAKIHINISVGETQDLQSKHCQKCGTLRIIGHPLRLIVLRTVQFNN